MQVSWRALIIGSVFLLFPLAHLRPLELIPIYSAEIPLLMLLLSLGCLYRHWPYWWRRISAQKSFVIGAGVFIGSAGLAFFFNAVPMHSLGLLKSFIILPCLFGVYLAALDMETYEHRVILSLWFLGLLATTLAGVVAFVFGMTTYDIRLALLYTSPNHLAMLLAPGVFIGFFLLQYFSNAPWRWLLQISLFLMIVTLSLTRSYGILAAVGMSSGPLVYKSIVAWSKRFYWLGLSLLLLIGIWAVGEVSTDKFQSLITLDERSSLASRLMIWKVAGTIAQDTFPWGIGIGRFQEVYLAYQAFFPPYLEWAVPEPHNLYLSLFFAVGLLGLGGFFWVVGSIGYRLYRLLASDEDQAKKDLAKLYGVLLSYWLLTGLIDTPYFKNDLVFGLWGIMGLAWALTAQRKNLAVTN